MLQAAKEIWSMKCTSLAVADIIIGSCLERILGSDHPLSVSAMIWTREICTKRGA